MSVDLDAGFNQQNNSSCLAYWLAAADRPDFFGYQIYWGLTCSDRYMWVYSEATD